MNDQLFYALVYSFTLGTVIVLLPSMCRFCIQLYFKERSKYE
jgi:hypothetical protein